jgi:thiamine monophosphate synthase
LRALCDAGELPPAETARVVERLLKLGVVATRARPAGKRKLSDKALAWVRAAEARPLFSADEEAFFASPIDHLVEDLNQG